MANVSISSLDPLVFELGGQWFYGEADGDFTGPFDSAEIALAELNAEWPEVDLLDSEELLDQQMQLAKFNA